MRSREKQRLKRCTYAIAADSSAGILRKNVKAIYPCFRLCHLSKPTPQATFGFTMRKTTRSTNGCIIGKVMADSPAQAGGLQDGDHLIEVNGCNVEGENEHQITARIVAGLRKSNDEPKKPKVSSPEMSVQRSNAIDPLAVKVMNSVSSSDSGVSSVRRNVSSRSKTSDSSVLTKSDDNGGSVVVANKREVLMLVIDHKSYVDYTQHRTDFVSTVPIVYFKPSSTEFLPQRLNRSQNDSIQNDDASETHLNVVGLQSATDDCSDSDPDAHLDEDDDDDDEEVVDDCASEVNMILKELASDDSSPISNDKIERMCPIYSNVIACRRPPTRDVGVEDSMSYTRNDSLDSFDDDGIASHRTGVLATFSSEAQPESPSRHSPCPKQNQMSRVNGLDEPFYTALDDNDTRSQHDVDRHNCPRLCHIRKVSTYVGYGFNLLSDKGLHAHRIGRVEPGSPASWSGLFDGDIVIEVNGTNVLAEPHRRIVARITGGLMRGGIRCKDEVMLLVVDQESKRWHDENNIAISYSMTGVISWGTNGEKRQWIMADNDNRNREHHENKNLGHDDQTRFNVSRSTSSSIVDASPTTTTCSSAHTKASDRKLAANEEPQANEQTGTTYPVSESSTTCTGQSTSNELNWDLSVAEMRQLLKERRKLDQRQRFSNISLQEKYRIVQNL